MKKPITSRNRLDLLLKLRKTARETTDDVWGELSKDEAVNKDVKARLRKSLKRRQEPRCCYCKRWLLNHASAAPIEHVLPRAIYPRFSLRVRNLAIVCVDCNAVKKAADWGKFPKPHKRYPSPETMLFFHPRYHKYDEHIRFLRLETNRQELVTYHGLTPQGRHLCNELLSGVVAKRSLWRSYPKLKVWLRTLEELEAQPETNPRPELEAFRNALDGIVGERLKDGGKAQAWWALPEQK
ncbi:MULTISPECIES: HNH endonuclease [unclassified Pseudomonas]|uniref:HNH endonuclease n=1 Tax=unclassified Pseudomonas TaxID=196821 RepID=UPI0035BF259A